MKNDGLGSIIAPDISIVASAFRPANWMRVYDSIGDNDVAFELIFVGPNEPNYALPDNFRFIKSEVKPTQCVEIGLRNARGEFVMVTADDCEFKTPRPLDKLYAGHRSANKHGRIVSCKFMVDGEDQSDRAHHFVWNDPTTPVMPLAGLISSLLLRDIGGIDKGFVAVMYDLDVAMRVYSLGGDVVLSDVYLEERKDRSEGSNLCREFWNHDRGLLESLWTTNGRVHFRRDRPVRPFSDVDILTRGQGPRGRWRGSGPVPIERVEDRLKNAGRKLQTVVRRACRGASQPDRYGAYAKRLLRRLAG